MVRMMLLIVAGRRGPVRGRLVCEPSLASHFRYLNRSVLSTRAFSFIRLSYPLRPCISLSSESCGLCRIELLTRARPLGDSAMRPKHLTVIIGDSKFWRTWTRQGVLLLTRTHDCGTSQLTFSTSLEVAGSMRLPVLIPRFSRFGDKKRQ